MRESARVKGRKGYKVVFGHVDDLDRPALLLRGLSERLAQTRCRTSLRTVHDLEFLLLERCRVEVRAWKGA